MTNSIILFGVSFFLSLVFIKLTQDQFLKNSFLDNFKDRSSHNVTATRSGGLAIILSLFVISVFYYLMRNEIYEFSLLVPLILIFVVGLYDDIYDVDFKLKNHFLAT